MGKLWKSIGVGLRSAALDFLSDMESQEEGEEMQETGAASKEHILQIRLRVRGDSEDDIKKVSDAARAKIEAFASMLVMTIQQEQGIDGIKYLGVETELDPHSD